MRSGSHHLWHWKSGGREPGWTPRDRQPGQGSPRSRNSLASPMSWSRMWPPGAPAIPAHTLKHRVTVERRMCAGTRPKRPRHYPLMALAAAATGRDSRNTRRKCRRTGVSFRPRVSLRISSSAIISADRNSLCDRRRFALVTMGAMHAGGSGPMPTLQSNVLLSFLAGMKRFSHRKAPRRAISPARTMANRL